LLSCQAPLVSVVLKVLMEDLESQVVQEVQVDQESLVEQDHLECLEIRVRQVGMGSRDQLESKETQVSYRSYGVDAA